MIIFFIFYFYYYRLNALASLPTTFVFLIWICALWGFAVGHVHIQDFFDPYPDKISLSDLQWYRQKHGFSATQRFTDSQIIQLYDDVYWDTIIQRVHRHSYYGGLIVLSLFALTALLAVAVGGRDLWFLFSDNSIFFISF
jgi:hypothetical protein